MKKVFLTLMCSGLVLIFLLACQWRAQVGSEEKNLFNHLSGSSKPAHEVNESVSSANDTLPKNDSFILAEDADQETMAEKEKLETRTQAIEERKKNPYPRRQKPEPIAKRVEKNGDVFISFPEADDTSSYSIMRFLSINIPDEAKIDNIENKNFFSFDISRLSPQDREWLLKGVEFEEGTKKSDAKVGDMYGYSGAACNANACVIAYHIDIRDEYYGKILGQTAILFVFDKHGKLISKIGSKEHGASGAMLTDDGKYLMVYNGGHYGEGGESYVQERMRIFEVESGKKIFETDKITDHSGLTQSNNLFYTTQRMSEKGGRIYHVFAPEKKVIYSLDISGNQISMFWEKKSDGIHLRDGTALKFERDFQKSTFSDFNQKQ